MLRLRIHGVYGFKPRVQDLGFVAWARGLVRGARGTWFLGFRVRV